MTNYKILSPIEEELITQFTDMILTDPKVRKAVAEHTKSVLSKVKSVLKNNYLMSGSVTPIHVFTSCFMHFISRQNFIHLELSLKTRHYFWSWREK